MADVVGTKKQVKEFADGCAAAHTSMSRLVWFRCRRPLYDVVETR